MKSNSVILAVEDDLSYAVSTKILERFNIEIVGETARKGKSYLQQKTPEFNRGATETCGVFMLTDLDSPNMCPPTLIQSWIRGSLNPWFFFRVAVMEIESWVMADRLAFSRFLSIPIHRIPRNTDNIPNPKEFLVSLARRGRQRTLHQGLVPAPGTIFPIGIRYNELLSDFVNNQWNLERAVAASPSLKRTVNRIRREIENVQKY